MVGWHSTTGALVFPALLVLWEVGYIQLFMQEPDITSLIISSSMQNWGIQSVGFVPVSPLHSKFSKNYISNKLSRIRISNSNPLVYFCTLSYPHRVAFYR